MTSQDIFDVFLCHNSEDKPQVKEIAVTLKARGVKPWLDVWEIRPGQAWQTVLETHIEGCKSAAVFVGSSGFGPWQTQELQALLRRFADRKCTIIPVLLLTAPNEPQLPIFLGNLAWVDFRMKDPDPMDQLVWAIEQGPYMGASEKVSILACMDDLEARIKALWSKEDPDATINEIRGVFNDLLALCLVLREVKQVHDQHEFFRQMETGDVRRNRKLGELFKRLGGTSKKLVVKEKEHSKTMKKIDIARDEAEEAKIVQDAEKLKKEIERLQGTRSKLQKEINTEKRDFIEGIQHYMRDKGKAYVRDLAYSLVQEVASPDGALTRTSREFIEQLVDFHGQVVEHHYKFHKKLEKLRAQQPNTDESLVSLFAEIRDERNNTLLYADKAIIFLSTLLSDSVEKMQDNLRNNNGRTQK